MVKKTRLSEVRDILNRHVDAVYPNRSALEEILQSGRKLRIYWGIDPTAPHVHIAHMANLFVLRRFQNLGHKVIVLVGDFTARIGDPTGKDITRRPLTAKEVTENSRSYKKAIFKILDSKKTEFRRNSEWWGRMGAEELLQLDDLFSHQQLVERDMFQRRIAERKPISMKEFQYPILQGYDSVALSVDVEIGGTDQLFNMMMGRNLVRRFLNKEKFVITTPLLEHPVTKARIMSKSSGVYIAVDDAPQEMYGKIMALPDEVIVTCFDLCTDVDGDALIKIRDRLDGGENPRILKAELAAEVVGIYYGRKVALRAAAAFDHTFKEKARPVEAPIIIAATEEALLDVLVRHGAVVSKSQGRRLFEQKAIELEGSILDDPKVSVGLGGVVRVGKHRFFKILVKK